MGREGGGSLLRPRPALGPGREGPRACGRASGCASRGRRSVMRSPPGRALLLITRRGPAVRAWAPAVSSRTWLASEWNPLVRAWTSRIHEPSPGLRFPAPLSRLPGGVGRWATSSAARRCWVLAGSRGVRPLFARFQGIPAAATGVRDLGDDSRRRPAAPRRSEVWKLLGLVHPERGKLSGRNLGGTSGLQGTQAWPRPRPRPRQGRSDLPTPVGRLWVPS